MEYAPAKWQKYMLLVSYGLLREDELLSQVKRYSVGETDNVLSALREDMRKESAKGRSHLYVIKLVPETLYGQLPNFRVSSQEDVLRLYKPLSLARRQGYKEIWYCRTRIDSRVFSVAGRISVSTLRFPKSQVIEQVWRCSPRLIESWHRGFQWPYVRAWRISWNWRFHLEEVHIPQSKRISNDRVLEDFRESVRILDRCKERLVVLADHIEECGINSYCFEYKIVDFRVTFIDWDTENDDLVLRRLALRELL